MATKKTSTTTAKKKSTARRPAAKRAPRKFAATPAATAARAVNADRLTEVAKQIGSTVGEIVAKTKKALHRG